MTECNDKLAHLYDEGHHTCHLELGHEGDHECVCGERWINPIPATLDPEEG